MKSLACALLPVATLWSSIASAEGPESGPASGSKQIPSATTSGSSTTVGEADKEPSASESPDAVPTDPPQTMEIDWRGPLKLFDLGQVDDALASLREQVLACGEPEEEKCTEPQFATLYASTAVVLAGSGDHAGGVRAFRRALTFTEVRLLPAYKTPEIERALAEARGEQPTPPAPAPAPAPPTSYPTYPEEPYVSPEFRQGKAFFGLSGIGGAGLISDGVFTVGVLRLAGAVTMASRTGEGRFAMGLRGSGGALVGNAALGTIGGTVLIGGMGIPQYRNRFGFVLGGLGIEHAPAVQTSLVAFDFLLGRAFGGGTVALSVHSGFNAYEYLNTVGIEVGVGGLSKAK